MRRNEAMKSGRLAAAVTGFLMAMTVGLCATVENAYAVPTLQLSDGVTTKTVSDEGLGDGLSGTAGAVMFSGSVGNFIVNVTTGLSKPLLGSATYPSLDLSSVNVSSIGGGTLTIMLTDTDFLSSTPFLIRSEIGGVASGNISYKSYFDASNAAFGTANLLGNLGSYSGAFSGSSLDNMTAIGPYSLTLAATVTHPGGGSWPQATSFNATLRVPEPGTVTLLGVGLLIVGLYSWRKRGAARP